ncbi:MAG: septal ring lytic transglycosylase RlpA family protein [Nodosilinea sp.]
MTLFGLLWAAVLPHYLNQPHLLPAASSYAAGYLRRQSVVDSREQRYSLPHLQSSAQRPLSARPQLAWPQTAAVDWSRWVATAAVSVVAQSGETHAGSGVTQITPTPSTCGSTPAAGGDSSAEGFTIRVKNVPIGQMPSRQAADRIADQIRQAVPALEAHPERLTPSLSQHQAAAQVSGKTVFVLPDAVHGGDVAKSQPSALKATQWVNNLRLAFGVAPLDPSQVQMVARGLGETRQTFSGTASWYGPYFHGRQTATGETFNQNDLTAAHKTLPFDTYLQVRNQLNGKSVVVRINDRGPYIGDRSLDLSYAAAQCLGSTQPGVIPYQATILVPGLPQAWRADAVATLP